MRVAFKKSLPLTNMVRDVKDRDMAILQTGAKLLAMGELGRRGDPPRYVEVEEVKEVP